MLRKWNRLLGQGAKAGRATGFCRFSVPGFANAGFGLGGRGRGLGFGRGAGFGQGFGRGAGFGRGWRRCWLGRGFGRGFANWAELRLTTSRPRQRRLPSRKRHLQKQASTWRKICKNPPTPAELKKNRQINSKADSIPGASRAVISLDARFFRGEMLNAEC